MIGDAAHACPPLIAQGAAMCAEDAVVLAELVTGEAPLGQARDLPTQDLAGRLFYGRAVFPFEVT